MASDFDFFDPEFQKDAHPHFARMRASAGAREVPHGEGRGAVRLVRGDA